MPRDPAPAPGLFACWPHGSTRSRLHKRWALRLALGLVATTGSLGCDGNKPSANAQAKPASTAQAAGVSSARIPTAHLRLLYTEVKPLPTIRNAFGMLNSENGDILVVGGELPSGTPSAAVSRFEARTRAWAIGTNMPTARHHFGYTKVANDRWVFVGGIEANKKRSAAVEQYDAQANRWTTLPALALGRVLPAVSTTASGEILVFGGRSAEKGCTKTCERLKPGQKVWEKCKPLAVATCDATALSVADGIYLFNGRDDKDLPVAAAKFNLENGEWTTASDPNQPRDSHAMNQLTNGQWLLSGGDRGPLRLKSLETFDPKTGIWSRVAAMPVGRAVHCAVTLNDGRVLLAGGNADGRFAVVDAHIFDPSNNSIRPATALPAGRSGHQCGALADGAALLLGGFNKRAQPAKVSWLIQPQLGPTP